MPADFSIALQEQRRIHKKVRDFLRSRCDASDFMAADENELTFGELRVLCAALGRCLRYHDPLSMRNLLAASRRDQDEDAEVMQ